MNFNLPDFTKCLEFNELFDMMGIKKVNLIQLTEKDFTRTVEKKQKVKLSTEETARFLNSFSKGVSITDRDRITTNKDGLLEINGASCCIYIKLQRSSLGYEGNSYKYHLFECRTIQGMIASGRKSRYVATSRHDGFFSVVKQNQYGETKETVEQLGLCKNCQNILREKGLLYNFNLQKFFENHKNNFSHEYVREETVTVQEQYSPSHAEIAKRYKEQAGYKCSICGLDCSENHELIHLHHIDGDGQNNLVINLKVLCARCHSRQPHHSHMKTRFANEISECERMSKVQGIVFNEDRHVEMPSTTKTKIRTFSLFDNT